MKAVIKRNSLRVLAVVMTVMCMNTLGVMASGSISSVDQSEDYQKLLSLSQEKWQWLSNRNVSALNDLFHQNAIFVGLDKKLNKLQTMESVEKGGFAYEQADIKNIVVRFMNENTAVVVSDINLSNNKDNNRSFVTTDVFVQNNGKWQLSSFSFNK